MKKSIVAASFAIALSSAAHAQSIEEDEVFLGYPNSTFYITEDATLYADGRVGNYSISGTVQDGLFKAKVRIRNSSDCEMIFNGTYYVAGDPVQFIDLGTGVSIEANSTETVTGQVTVKSARTLEALTFAPHGWLEDCE